MFLLSYWNHRFFFCKLVTDATMRRPSALINFDLVVIWWLALPLHTKTDDKKPLGVEWWVFFLFCFVLLIISSCMQGLWLNYKCQFKKKKKKRLRPVSHSVASFTLSFPLKASLILHYCTHGVLLRCVICLEAVQREWDPCIMIQKRGIWGRAMRRMDCGCCVGPAEMTDVAWEKADLGRFRERAAIQERYKKKNKNKNTEWGEKLFLGSSWSHLSVWQKYDSAVWKTEAWAWFEMFHRL